MTIKKKILVSTIAIFTSLALISIGYLYNNANNLPLIKGVIFPNPIALKEFSVLDHHNKPFTNNDLLGNWHVVSYGYTNCPDVCPTTLSVLSRVLKNIEQDNKYTDTKMVFYSIDYKRDTVEHLAEYMPFFHDKFIGLTYNETLLESAFPFEKSLGLMYVIAPTERADEAAELETYTVSHGFKLFLINPQGQLHAVFRPEKGSSGILSYKVDQLLADYYSIRDRSI